MIRITPPAAAANLADLQRRMKNLGVYSGTADSDWGPGTQRGFEQIFAAAEAAAGVQPPPRPKFPNLDPDYAWLETLELPPMVAAALPDLGTVELAGAANSPTLMRWALEAGLKSTYTADSVPWCGLAMTHWAKAAGFVPVANPLWALNWNKFGRPAGQPGLGDVLTFTRNGGGHVAIYIGEDAATYHILGGNQSDKVSITRIEKKRLSQANRPPYTQLPANVRPFVLSPVGRISTNEA